MTIIEQKLSHGLSCSCLHRTIYHLCRRFYIKNPLETSSIKHNIIDCMENNTFSSKISHLHTHTYMMDVQITRRIGVKNMTFIYNITNSSSVNKIKTKENNNNGKIFYFSMKNVNKRYFFLYKCHVDV